MDKLFRHINPKGVIDVGAHVGNFTKQIYYKYPTCEIVMVEANPNCEQYLRLLGKPYDMVALSHKEGYGDLYIEKINPTPTGASLYKENTEWYGEGKYETIKVPTSTLDAKNYFPNQSIDLLKLDTQGAELDILNGGQETLKRTQYALIETSLAEYNLGAPMIDKIVDKMNECGFYIVDIIEYHIYNGLIFQMDILFKKNQYL
jgi:FkbM family methyltransferase